MTAILFRICKLNVIGTFYFNYYNILVIVVVLVEVDLDVTILMVVVVDTLVEMDRPVGK